MVPPTPETIDCNRHYWDVMKQAKPFLKWVGGKSQLLSQMEVHFPVELQKGRIRRYVEPFVGGGAVFLHIAQHYRVEEIHLFDINPELVLAYRTLQKDVEALIEQLTLLEAEYEACDLVEQREFFYRIRKRFNAERPQIDFELFSPTWTARTAQLIFLNRTGYNGLFRVNGRSEFNVPFGRYRNPTICAAANLRAIATVLQRAELHCCSFGKSESLAGAGAFFYFDPPYRPLSRTARFTSYSTSGFDDTEQLKLAAFYRKLDSSGSRLMLSNSDPHNADPGDDFFERAFAGFRLERVSANRMINCNAQRRGAIQELLILNY